MVVCHNKRSRQVYLDNCNDEIVDKLRIDYLDDNLLKLMKIRSL